MADVRFSIRARADLKSIGLYTIQTWGASQADRYLAGLEDCFLLLATNPALGRTCGGIRAGLRRMEKGRNVIFFREEPDGILIYRILHAGMLPGKHESRTTEASPAPYKFFSLLCDLL